jgi:hypothetical protein
MSHIGLPIAGNGRLLRERDSGDSMRSARDLLIMIGLAAGCLWAAPGASGLNLSDTKLARRQNGARAGISAGFIEALQSPSATETATRWKQRFPGLAISIPLLISLVLVSIVFGVAMRGSAKRAAEGKKSAPVVAAGAREKDSLTPH